MTCDYCSQDPATIHRALALLAWFGTFKQQVDTLGLSGEPVPEFLTRGDVARQHALSFVAAAEEAMARGQSKGCPVIS